MAEKIISKEEVKKIADLSGLDISGQSEKLSDILSDTLDYVKTLEKLDTSGVEETFQVTGLTNVFQGDEKSDSLKKDEALYNAHEEINGLFSTKPVFDR